MNIFMTRFNEARLAEYYVQPLEKEKALEELKKRISQGEEPKDIIKIEDDYYRNKVIKGLCPMSALVYTRIMQEMSLPMPEPELMHCLRCGKIIKGNAVYCPKCNDKYKPSKNLEASTLSLPYVRHKSKKGVYPREDL